MKVIDFIVSYIEEQKLTQTEAAAKAGMSRQNFWDKLNKANPHFASLERIVNGFGFELQIVRNDGKPLEFSPTSFFNACREDDVACKAMEDMLEAMEYRLEIVESK